MIPIVQDLEDRSYLVLGVTPIYCIPHGLCNHLCKLGTDASFLAECT
jgi:hypothetical protein